MMYVRKLETLTLKQWLAGGAALLVIALLLESHSLPSFGSKASEPCQKVTKTASKLSKEQIARLLTVEQGATKSKVRGILKEPHCKLPKVQVRADTPPERDVYLVDADDFVELQPKTQLVVLYDGDEYKGFRFWVH
ncbi:MAG: hypothetical protein KME13_02920 [Myxacorys californica WJT36-NPBG1]|nr:hypothetical protein [Myxacorys californica WJT36-NPBG1]